MALVNCPECNAEIATPQINVKIVVFQFQKQSKVKTLHHYLTISGK